MLNSDIPYISTANISQGIGVDVNSVFIWNINNIFAFSLFVVILTCVLISAVVANGIIVAALFPIVALVIIARVIIGLPVIASRNGNCFNSSPRTAEAPRG